MRFRPRFCSQARDCLLLRCHLAVLTNRLSIKATTFVGFSDLRTDAVELGHTNLSHGGVYVKW